MPNCLVDFEKLSWTSPMPGVREKYIVEDGLKLRLVEYSASMEPHWCEKGHAGQILEGRFEIRFDDMSQILEAGDHVLIKAGRANRHMAKSLTEKVTALFVERA